MQANNNIICMQATISVGVQQVRCYEWLGAEYVHIVRGLEYESCIYSCIPLSWMACPKQHSIQPLTAW
jgi:hypothetical protein